MRPGTEVVDAPSATVLPAFDDTHTHLILAGARAFSRIPVHEARDLAGFLELIRERAARTPVGEWILTTVNWQEVLLAEQRMPTTGELDGAPADHPVLVRRGAYNMVLNSAALRLAGIDGSTEAPSGGVIERDQHGRLTGRLINRATELVERVLPRPTLADRIEGLRAASADYAATGIGTAPRPSVPVEDLDVLDAARAEGALAVRVRALVSGFAARTPEQVDSLLDRMDRWRTEGRDDARLRLWGVKFGIDGGFEAGALAEPYQALPCYHGRRLWEPGALLAAVDRVVERGWQAGVHAWGDRGLRVLLDVFEQVLKGRPGVCRRAPSWSSTADWPWAPQRARAIALGIPGRCSTRCCTTARSPSSGPGRGAHRRALPAAGVAGRGSAALGRLGLPGRPVRRDGVGAGHDHPRHHGRGRRRRARDRAGRGGRTAHRRRRPTDRGERRARQPAPGRARRPDAVARRPAELPGGGAPGAAAGPHGGRSPDLPSELTDQLTDQLADRQAAMSSRRPMPSRCRARRSSWRSDGGTTHTPPRAWSRQ
ncbi:hypothetical protein KAURM247S_01890 [Kitasatospora aureofaciens]